MEVWKTLNRETILAHSKYLTIEDHTVELPDGRVIAKWPWVITPDYINVVAETGDGRIICFRQTKYGVAQTSLAPVGGYLEPGEEPQRAAQRELLEETGYTASEWVALGSYIVDGNRGAGTAYLYLARGAERTAAINADDLEEQELLLLSRAEFAAAVSAGEFKVLPWATVAALALLHLNTYHPLADK